MTAFILSAFGSTRGGIFATESQNLGQKKMDLNLGPVQVECESCVSILIQRCVCTHTNAHV